jgi:hypothetical protein
VGDTDFEAILSIQLTVGVLSQRVPIGSHLVCGAFARRIPMANTSAASSRSELVSLPWGRSSETTSVAISAGNGRRHTHGGMSWTNENHTPPDPSAAASWYPT